jgi:glucokinase
MTRGALVADIGGTHARFAMADLDGGALRDIRTLVNSEHATLEAAIRNYCVQVGETSAVAAVAMAGPVRADGAQLTNGAWGFETAALRRRLGLEALYVLNDFEALALSLPELQAGDVVQIGDQAPMPDGIKIVLGPGTGFGGAVLLPGTPARVLPGEPGHASLPVRTPAEAVVAIRLADPGGHVPVENAVSGPGLLATYRACAALAGRAAPLTSAAEIAEAARRGDEPSAIEAVDLFLVWLGRAAGNIAMQLRADGGIYIGGGIAPKLLDLLSDGRFRSSFEGMGRMAGLIRTIPVYVITAEAPALLGCAARLRSAAA